MVYHNDQLLANASLLGLPISSQCTLLVAAAGKGSRLGYSAPKTLYKVNEKPIIDHILDSFLPFCQNVVLIVSEIGLPVIKKHVHAVRCVDAFGQAPRACGITGKFLRRGLASESCVAAVAPDTDAVAVYALNLLNHDATLAVVRAVRKRFPHIPLAVVENSQAVTSYSLAESATAFQEAGADVLLTGENDCTLVRWLENSRDISSGNGGVVDGGGVTFRTWERCRFPPGICCRRNRTGVSGMKKTFIFLFHC